MIQFQFEASILNGKILVLAQGIRVKCNHVKTKTWDVHKFLHGSMIIILQLGDMFYKDSNQKGSSFKAKSDAPMKMQSHLGCIPIEILWVKLRFTEIILHMIPFLWNWRFTLANRHLFWPTKRKSQIFQPSKLSVSKLDGNPGFCGWKLLVVSNLGGAAFSWPNLKQQEEAYHRQLAEIWPVWDLRMDEVKYLAAGAGEDECWMS